MSVMVAHPTAPLLATGSTAQVVKVWTDNGDVVSVVFRVWSRAHCRRVLVDVWEDPGWAPGVGVVLRGTRGRRGFHIRRVLVDVWKERGGGWPLALLPRWSRVGPTIVTW